jgi:hypothetical protein
MRTRHRDRRALANQPRSVSPSFGFETNILAREAERSFGITVDNAVLVARCSGDDLSGAVVSRAHDKDRYQ